MVCVEFPVWLQKSNKKPTGTEEKSLMEQPSAEIKVEIWYYKYVFKNFISSITLEFLC